MCGISVIISRSNCGVDKGLLKSMTDKIIHRGPDDDGYYYGNNFGFGFRRLSILDLSPSGHQPMEYLDRYVIIHNGEVYNYIELKEQLHKLGYDFISGSDTEVILAAYDYWGNKCVKYFNGMWAFVIYDKKKNILFCSRDRYGIKPFNYLSINNLFLISSEIKQFTIFNDFIPKLNIKNAMLFLAESKLNTNDNTFFSEVKVLPAGSNLIYNLSDHSYKIEKYYEQLAVKENTNISYDDAVIEFKRLFTKAVSLRLRSDVRIGSCLSGGLDSSSIISIAKNITAPSFTPNTISSCYNDSKYDEQEYINEVTLYTGYNSIKIFPNLSDLIYKQRLEEINYHQDQPIASASHFSEYSVFKAAKENKLVVMLDGQGADEYLAGYLPFQLFNYSLIKSNNFPLLLKELYYQHKNHYNLYSLIMYNTVYLANKIFNRSENNKKQWQIFDTDLIENYILPDQRVSRKFNSYRELSLNEINSSSIPYQLHSEDRNSMLHSIESRLPFLDFELTDFIYSLPDTFKIKNGTTKSVLRDAMREYLPKKIVNRHSKLGFAAPDEIFIRTNYVEIRKLLVNALEVMNGMIKKSVLTDFDNMISNRINYNQVYFRIVSFYYWQNAFNININI